MNLGISDKKKDGGRRRFFQGRKLLKGFRLEKAEKDRCDDTAQGCI